MLSASATQQFVKNENRNKNYFTLALTFECKKNFVRFMKENQNVKTWKHCRKNVAKQGLDIIEIDVHINLYMEMDKQNVIIAVCWFSLHFQQSLFTPSFSCLSMGVCARACERVTSAFNKC